MKFTETDISFLALAISLVTLIWQIWSSYNNSKQTKTANENALKANIEANETSKNLLDLEKKISDTEQRKGEIILIFMIQRYLIAFYNLFENKIPNYPTIKNDRIAQKQFIKECKFIESDLQDLINNPSYLNLIEKHPHISKHRVDLSFDIIDMEEKLETVANFDINFYTYFMFKDLFYLFKNEYKNNSLTKSEVFKDLEKSFEIIKIERPIGI